MAGKRKRSPPANVKTKSPTPNLTAAVPGLVQSPPNDPGADSPWPPTAHTAKVDRVVRWIAEGRSNAELYDLVEAEFGPELAAGLCETAVRDVISAGQAGRDFAIGWALTAAMEVYRRALGITVVPLPEGAQAECQVDLETALRAIKLIATLGERLD